MAGTEILPNCSVDLSLNNQITKNMTCANCSTFIYTLQQKSKNSDPRPVHNNNNEPVSKLVIDSQNKLEPTTTTPRQKRGDKIIDVHTALSSMYKLGQDDPHEEELMVICKTCASILLPLFQLYYDFNQLRQLNSILDQKIKTVDAKLHAVPWENHVEEEFHKKNSNLKEDIVDYSTPDFFHNDHDYEQLNDDTFTPVETTRTPPTEKKKKKKKATRTRFDLRCTSKTEKSRHKESICIENEGPKSKKRLCPTCGRMCASAYSLQNHLHVHRGESLPCPHPNCDRKFAYKASLRTHLKNHDEDKLLFKCPATNCDKTLTSAQKLKYHIHALHPELIEDPDAVTHLCTVCGKRILGSTLKLKRHMLNHSEERPHKCHLCEAAFKTKNVLVDHLKIHSGVRDHHCQFPGCNKSFFRAEGLRRHSDIHNDVEKTYECQVCHMLFLRPSGLKIHSFKHGERKYGCHLCEKVFKHPRVLKQHLARHNKSDK